VLAERVALPVLGHEDADEVVVALEADAQHVPRLALEPVGGRPDREDARDRLVVVEPDLDADADRILVDAKEVVRDREALRLPVRDAGEPLGSWVMHVPPGGGPAVARYFL